VDMLDTLRRTGGLDALAARLSLKPAEATLAVGALIPPLLGGFRDYCEAGSSCETGIARLDALIARSGGVALARRVMTPGDASVVEGERILIEIFGAEETCRTIAMHAGGQSGLQTRDIRKVMTLLTMLVSGYMAARSLDGSEPGSQLDVAQMLDLGGQANPLDAILPDRGQ
jgi:hypothetical protein